MKKESRKSLKIEEVIAVVYSPLKHGTNKNNSEKFSLYFKGNYLHTIKNISSVVYM
jgi:hypothetical protein